MEKKAFLVFLAGSAVKNPFGKYTGALTLK